MVANFTKRTYGVNQTLRFVEGIIWLNRTNRKIWYFFRKRPILHPYMRNMLWATILYHALKGLLSKTGTEAINETMDGPEMKFAGYPAAVELSRIPDIRQKPYFEFGILPRPFTKTNIRRNTEYLDKYPVGYRISGQKPGGTPNIWTNTRGYTEYPDDHRRIRD